MNTNLEEVYFRSGLKNWIKCRLYIAIVRHIGCYSMHRSDIILSFCLLQSFIIFLTIYLRQLQCIIFIGLRQIEIWSINICPKSVDYVFYSNHDQRAIGNDLKKKFINKFFFLTLIYISSHTTCLEFCNNLNIDGDWMTRASPFLPESEAFEFTNHHKMHIRNDNVRI